MLGNRQQMGSIGVRICAQSLSRQRQSHFFIFAVYFVNSVIQPDERRSLGILVKRMQKNSFREVWLIGDVIRFRISSSHTTTNNEMLLFDDESTCAFSLRAAMFDAAWAGRRPSHRENFWTVVHLCFTFFSDCRYVLRRLSLFATGTKALKIPQPVGRSWKKECRNMS